MCSARHLGGNGCQRLALEIGIVAITSNVALILGFEAVITLANGDLSRNPERACKDKLRRLPSCRWPFRLDVLFAVVGEWCFPTGVFRIMFSSSTRYTSSFS